MSNRLAGQGSPYLLQHASNPVNWYPWGEEAIEAARREDKPIFLSIGYSACHWCHVMAHESFEDPEIARLLNEQFISIKVDREEHPEVDQLYMESIQMMTGQGGWPLSVFLTPHLEPFFGGTYWPPQSRGRMLGFRDILIAVNEIWKFRRGEAVRQGTQLIEWLKKSEVGDPAAGKGQLGPWLIQNAYSVLSRLFDPHFGGFGPAPKFPHPGALRLLLRWWRRLGEEPVRNLVTVTLDHMAAGGIYDHVGGGFHRYSTDAQWLVPHFEKMLYDNAMLAGCYLEAWQATGRGDYARLVHETLDYLLRDLAGPEGGFASSEDADSDRREGAFYLWTFDELQATLGAEDARTFAAVYDVTEEGNFEGKNLLARSRPWDVAAIRLARDPESLRIEIADILRRLRKARARRPRPARDEKILVNWNALAVDTLAQAGMALGQSRYIDAAQATTEFLLERLLRGRRLFHCGSRSEAAVDGFLDDYAALGSALFSLYEARFNERWIDVAMGLADEILARFFDPEQGRFFFTSADAPLVPVRKVDVFDNPTPSGAGLAIGLLLRLGRLCGRNDYLEAAHNALAASVEIMRQSPIGAGQILLALDAYLGPMPQLVLLGRMDQPETADVLSSLRRRYLPNRLVAFREEGSNGRHAAALDAAFQGKQNAQPGPTLWLCEQFRCQAPVSGKDAILKTLASLSEPAQVAVRG